MAVIRVPDYVDNHGLAATQSGYLGNRLSNRNTFLAARSYLATVGAVSSMVHENSLAITKYATADMSYALDIVKLTNSDALSELAKFA